MNTTGPTLIPGDRRRIERLAQLLEEAAGGPRRHVRSRVDDELAPQLAVAQQLSQLPRLTPELDPEFRTGLRAMLVATAEREGIGVTARPGPADLPARRGGFILGSALAGSTPGSRARTRGAVIVGVAVGTLALSGMSAVSGDAMPGDALYGIKRSTERAQLALAGSDASRGQLYLEFARTRAAEADAVQSDTGGLPAVLEDMDNETTQGVRLLTTAAVNRHDPAMLDAVDKFTTSQRRRIGNLLGVPAEAQGRVARSLQLLDSIAGRAAALRTALACNAAAPHSDELGPVPLACAASVPRAGAGNGRPSAHPTEPQRAENTVPASAPASVGPNPAPSGSPSGSPTSSDGPGRAPRP